MSKQNDTELYVDFKEWNPSNKYGPPKLNKMGGKSVKPLNVKGQTHTVITPLMLDWGMNKNRDENTGRVSFNVALQFPKDEFSNDDCREFFDKMKQHEDSILKDAIVNSKDWFNKSNLSEEVADALYSRSLKYPYIKGTKEPDYSRSPSFKLKIPYYNEQSDVEIFDTEGNCLHKVDYPVDENFVNLIPKGSYMKAIIQCNSIWFVNGKFGVTWQLVHCIVRKPQRINGNGRCLLKLSDNENTQIKTISEREQREQEENENGEGNVYDVAVDDSDEDEEETKTTTEEVEKVAKKEVETFVEEKKVVAAPPAKKKKRVIKKKTATTSSNE